jgi:hypothetical protein
MAVGGFKEAPAFSIPTGPSTSIGAEGDIARVSIASLLEGAGSPIVAAPDGGGANHISVGQHGMIADLYSSGSLSSVTLDFGLATPVTPAIASDLALHDVLGTVSGGNAHVPLADLFHEEVGAGSDATSLGFFGEQRVPDDIHVTAGGQSALGGFDGPRVSASIDNFAMEGVFAFGHHEMGTLLGGDGLPMPIGEQHFIV